MQVLKRSRNIANERYLSPRKVYVITKLPVRVRKRRSIRIYNTANRKTQTYFSITKKKKSK